jgi:hypothetical protein
LPHAEAELESLRQMAKHNPDEYEFTWSPTTAAMMNAA